MHITIATVDQNLYDGDAASLTVPATDGIMTVLPHHQPFITTLKEGIAIVRTTDDSKQEFRIQGGVLEVHKTGATVIL